MKSFEIHITGDGPNINKELDALEIKNIVVDLLRPDLSILRTEYMSSFVEQFETLDECKAYTYDLVKKLETKIIRVKIETPYYEEYVKDSLYMETHFRASISNLTYPISRNSKSGKLIATDRIYGTNLYPTFMEEWKDEEIELCVFDNNMDEDEDWFSLYMSKFICYDEIHLGAWNRCQTPCGKNNQCETNE